jgi:Flp pilus assembly protein TadB
VSWLLAAGFAAAVWCLGGAVLTRRDPRVRTRLAVRRSPRRSRLARLGRSIGRSRLPGVVAGRIEAAGGSAADVDRVLGQKVCGALLGAVVWLLVLPGGPAGLLLGAVLISGGFVLPDLLLARRAALLRERAEASVADLLDLVAVSVSAGLTPRLALERAPEALGGPLGDEVSRARHAASLGSPWRLVIRRVAARTGLPELLRLAVTLERSERLGTPVAGRLRDLAREVRADRAARREERARRAPVTMLFPLVFLILPAFVVAAVVPALLVATRGLP